MPKPYGSREGDYAARDIGVRRTYIKLSRIERTSMRHAATSLMGQTPRDTFMCEPLPCPPGQCALYDSRRRSHRFRLGMYHVAIGGSDDRVIAGVPVNYGSAVEDQIVAGPEAKVSQTHVRRGVPEIRAGDVGGAHGRNSLRGPKADLVIGVLWGPVKGGTYRTPAKGGQGYSARPRHWQSGPLRCASWRRRKLKQAWFAGNHRDTRCAFG